MVVGKATTSTSSRASSSRLPPAPMTPGTSTRFLLVATRVPDRRMQSHSEYAYYKPSPWTSSKATKRTYRHDLLFVRSRATADMHARVASTASVANDPKRTLGHRFLARNWPTVLAVFPYKGRRHLVSDSGPWPYVSRPTFVLSSPNHVNEKHAEATEQQDSACR